MKRMPLTWQQISMSAAVVLTPGLIAFCVLTGHCGAEVGGATPQQTADTTYSQQAIEETHQSQGTQEMTSTTATKKTYGQVYHVSSADFQQEVLNSESPVLVDFYADWCGPCRMLAPVLEELASEVPEAKIVKVDVDDAPDLAAKYGVNSIPMLIAFNEGKPTAQVVGLTKKDALKRMLSPSK
jgi:thioredoxin 1